MKIGLLTGGGDCPGLNAVIRAIVRSAGRPGGFEVLGIEDGFEGLMSAAKIRPLRLEEVKGLLPTGGTILGTSNRGNPFAHRTRNAQGVVAVKDLSVEWLENFHRLQLDGLVVIGGDGTLRVANELMKKGVPVVGIPKTIDNDISATELSFGFDTAVQTATDALDKLHTTAASHHRTMYLEVMGRHAGWIALHAGIAGGADVILIPEIPFHYEGIAAKLRERIQVGRNFSIVVVAEGARAAGGEQVYRPRGEGPARLGRLGGIAEKVCGEVSRHIRQDARVTVLGHLQRGGSPTAFDRALATRFGTEAARLVTERRFGNMVALRCSQVIEVPLAEAIGRRKQVDPRGEPVAAARAIGISFGDIIA